MTFREKIDYLLKENNLKNLKQLSDITKIPYTTLWDYYSNPTRLEKANLTNIKKIANHLKCNIDFLVNDELETLYYIAYKILNDKGFFNGLEIFKKIPKDISDELKLNDSYPYSEEELENDIDDLPLDNLEILVNKLVEFKILNNNKNVSDKELNVILNFIENNKEMLKNLIEHYYD